jgi:hypothetical protein
MSKKLIATLVVNVLGAALLALNNKLGLGLPESVQVAVASGAAAVALWYLQKHGVVDAEEAKKNA